MVIRTIVVIVFFVLCTVVMHKIFWMLDQTVPNSKEPEIVVKARHWN